tara:strand:- start:319 stop:627 length:309 start_codon:yes stop_codon:yes gene_type:complete
MPKKKTKTRKTRKTQSKKTRKRKRTKKRTGGQFMEDYFYDTFFPEIPRPFKKGVVKSVKKASTPMVSGIPRKEAAKMIMYGTLLPALALYGSTLPTSRMAYG